MLQADTSNLLKFSVTFSGCRNLSRHEAYVMAEDADALAGYNHSHAASTKSETKATAICECPVNFFIEGTT